MEFDKILELLDDDKVQLAQSFKNEINKKLALGMTKYVCRYGTLSDGHEKITDAQRYFQAIKEMYMYGIELENQKVLAMEAQADLMDAEEALELAEKASDKIRAEAKIMKAKNMLTSCLVNIEDKKRCLEAFNEVRLELKDQVEAQYPNGIEQAEEDNWKAVAKYQIYKKKLGRQAELTHLPLHKETKAKMGLEMGAPEMAVWLGVTDPRKLNELQEKNPHKLEVKE